MTDVSLIRPAWGAKLSTWVSFWIQNQNQEGIFWRSSLGTNVLTCDFFKSVGPHIKQHGAIQDAGAQFKKTVKWQRGYIWFTPPFTTVLDILFKLQPPEDTAASLKRCTLLILTWENPLCRTQQAIAIANPNPKEPPTKYTKNKVYNLCIELKYARVQEIIYKI